MCGIIGTTDPSISESLFRKGMSILNHRGPDYSSIIVEKTVKFGHTRLAILDLEERSNQPFVYNHNGKKILITYNGEVYNYLLLKNKLINKGYKFNTQSDTEVIAASYLEWGEKCFNYLTGMWAIAIKDSDKIILSRDRVGKKPFYYSMSKNKHLSFSSNLKALSLITEKKTINKDGLELYFALGFIPKYYSIFNNILKLEPGDVKIYIEKNKVYIPYSTYKSKLFSTKNNLNFKTLLKQAIDTRLIGDVPIATLMSGGVDSTIVSTKIKESNKNVESFFVDFNDNKLSEKKWANYLAKRNSIKLNTILLEENNLIESFNNYYNAYEEPFADYSGIPSIAIFKEVSKKYKVVLTGDGGDELFYGYPHYFKKFLIYRLFHFLKIFKKMKFIPSNLRLIIGNKKIEFESNYLKNHGIVTPFAAKIVNDEFNNSIKLNKGFLRGVIDYDRTFYNWPEKYLVKVDRASMYSSVEVRSPFMDEHVLEKIKKTSLLKLFTPFSKKLFLKINYFQIFGIKYFRAKKQGFTPPIDILRNKYFSKEEFSYSKSIIQDISEDLFNEIESLTFEDIKNDKILFDRFFFFHEWFKKYKNDYYVQK